MSKTQCSAVWHCMLELELWAKRDGGLDGQDTPIMHSQVV